MSHGGDEQAAAAARPAGCASSAAEPELRRFVEQCLGAPVEALARRPLAQSTSFPCEILAVQSGGRAHELFFKDYGSCRLPRASGDGPEREIEVYRRLLDPEALGTARHLGSLREAGREWLLLECVRGTRLAESPDAWLAAAAWPAKLQALAKARDVARPGAPLVLHDAAQLQATARQAVVAAARVDSSFEGGLLKALEDYETIVERIADQPRTLVHGSYRPENILVDEGVRPARVAPVDWEHAAVGCALYDIAFLTAGLERARAEELLRAFTSAAVERGLDVPTGEPAWQLVRSLRVHKHLRSLGRAVSWGYARATVEHLVELVGQACLELRTELRAESRSGSAGNPALRAWRTLGLEECGPASIERIKGRFFSRKGRVVYRLGPIGPGRSPVVAKRCPREVAALEHRAYELLSELRVPAPRCHGLQLDGPSSWLFLEDVGGRRLDPADPAQRALGLDFLARLHGASARRAPPGGLPDRGARRHLALLCEARQVIHAGLANPVLSELDREALQEVIATCERVEAGWERIEAVCAGMPRTLVHGDFRPKNLYLREGGGGLALLAIDWEYSGWGVPAADLGALLREHGEPAELASYRAALEPSVPGLGEKELWTWVWAGRAMRAVSSIHWMRNSVAQAYVEKAVGNLGLYRRSLERAFEELGAATPARGTRA